MDQITRICNVKNMSMIIDIKEPKNMRKLAAILATCAIGVSCGDIAAAEGFLRLAAVTPLDSSQPGAPKANTPADDKNLAGDYLSSMFAQRHHDWKKAGEYLNDVLKVTPNEASLSKRAMALAMGSGDAEEAIDIARKVLASDDSSSLAHLFVAVGAFHDKKYQEAADNIKAMPTAGLSDFIMPLMISWSQASIGVLDIANLDKNTIHIHHATLIADFLNKPADISGMLDKLAEQPNLPPEDLERAANIYAHIDQPEKASKLYQKILTQWPDDPETLKKIDSIKAGKKVETFVPVASPEQGVSASLYDMANLLFRENADDSARVFAQMSLYLTPKMTDGRLLLAAIDARNERYEEAIASYKMVPTDNPYYVDAQRRAADLMEDNGDTQGAINTLKNLTKNKDDITSMIKIGDIYRREENYTKAIEVYNDAAKKLGDKIPFEYWNLLYVRGMSYERAGQWDKAEADLKAALVYQPDQPYILNYLGFAWADHGENLDQALALVRKAATEAPNDGYIIDSLGWVYFKMGRYGEALPNLEKAVELLAYDPVVNEHLGDDYWRLGRKREATFQWKRAGNNSSNKELTARLDKKITDGLPIVTDVKQEEAPAVDDATDSDAPDAAADAPNNNDAKDDDTSGH